MSDPAPPFVDVVLVPLDGSERSSQALPVAAELADRLGAGVVLFSAVASENMMAEREAQLCAIELPGRRVQVSVVVDLDAAGAIHEALKRLDGSIACLATRGRGRSAALIGSVAAEVVARGHDPLVMVGPAIGRPGGLWWEDEPISLARLRPGGVVACVDESPSSAAAILVAFGWAALLRRPLTVLTVAELVPPPIRPGPVHRDFGPDGDPEAYLEVLLEPLRGKGVDVIPCVRFEPTSPAQGVHSYLEGSPASLVVVSSRSRLGLARLALGSVAADIVHRSPSPVLVLPRPDLPVDEAAESDAYTRVIKRDRGRSRWP